MKPKICIRKLGDKMPYSDVNTIRMYYELHGSGDPFVFISGTGCHGKIWKPYQVPFFGKNYASLIYDHRGTGGSDKPDEEYSTAIFADDLAALLDSLSLPKAHVLGHSMGGRVAQMLALRHPEKVRSLILAATGSGEYSPGVWRSREVPLHTIIDMVEIGYPKYLKIHFMSEFCFPPRFIKEHPERVEEIGNLFGSEPPPLYAYLRHIIARQRHETTARLREIKCPCLVIVGDNDVVNNHRSQSEALVRALPNVEFVLVPGTRHNFLWQEPELANNLILDFVRKH